MGKKTSDRLMKREALNEIFSTYSSRKLFFHEMVGISENNGNTMFEDKVCLQHGCSAHLVRACDNKQIPEIVHLGTLKKGGVF